MPFYKTLDPSDFAPALPKLFLTPLGKTQGQQPFLRKRKGSLPSPSDSIAGLSTLISLSGSKTARNEEKLPLSLSGYGKFLGVLEMVWKLESFLSISPLLPSTCWTTTTKHPGLAPRENQSQRENYQELFLVISGTQFGGSSVNIKIKAI